MKIYKPQIVQDLRSFYGNDLLENIQEVKFVKEYLSILAEKMFAGVNENYSFIFQEINNYHKSYLGKPIVELEKLNLSLKDCKQTIANEYGFQNWESIDDTLNYDKSFEAVVGFLLNGQFDNLKKAIAAQPDLLFRKSQFEHQATLLHYVGSNGVEFWRQLVPKNLPEMTKWLIEKGADKNAKMKVYGGEFDVLALLKSSAHPYAAGIATEMIEILK